MYCINFDLTYCYLLVNNILIDDSDENNGADSQHLQARKSRLMARHLELDDGDLNEGKESKKQIKLGLSKRSVNELLFYRSLFVPILFPYLYVVDKLKSLVDVEYISVQEFLRKCTGLSDKDTDRIPVILSRFEIMKVFASGLTEYKKEKSVRVMWLTEEWNDLKVLETLALKIYRYIVRI